MNPNYYQLQPLNSDYLNRDGKLSLFYRYQLKPDWEKVAREVASGFKLQQIYDEIARQNSSTALQDDALAGQLEQMKKGKTLFVVSGQQLGLTVSPLYVLYKAVTAIKLARKLDDEIKDYHVAPLFWLEGEDHDFEEVAHTRLWDHDGSLKHLKLDEQEPFKRFSLNRRSISPQINTLLEEIDGILQDTDFKAPLMEQLQKNYSEGNNWLDAFSGVLHFLLQGSGLLHFNNGSSTVKKLSVPFFQNLVRKNETLCNALREDSQKLEQAGYRNQVHFLEDRAWLFLSYEDGGRDALLRDKEGFRLKDNDAFFDTDRLCMLAEKEPGWFSSTVFTRPLWQSYLLPTISYVAGNAEIAYWAQLKSAFDAFDIVMPHVQPRHSITLLEPKTQRLLDKYEIDKTEIPASAEDFLHGYFSRQAHAEINTIFKEYAEDAQKASDKLQKFVDSVDPTLQKPLQKTFQSMQHNLDKFKGRLLNRLEEKEKQTRDHLLTIHDALLPGGILQERSLGTVYFYNKYGGELVEALMRELNMQNFSEHLFVEL